MRILSYLILILAGFFLLRNCFGEKRKQETLKDLLAPGNQEARELSESFERVLPQMDKTNNARLARVNDSGHRLDVVDVLDRLDGLQGNAETEGLLYTRSILLSREYNATEKEEVLEHASEILSPNEIKLLSRDLLLMGNETSLYPIALEMVTKSMSKNEIEAFLRELLRERQDELLRDAVMNFALSHEIIF